MEIISVDDLKGMMLASCARIEKEKDQINKINVFPVPDQDTGNNFNRTLQGIREAIENKEFEDASQLSEKILDGALTGAQGNAGVIYTGFLVGFLSDLKPVQTINTEVFGTALQKGYERARASIQNPKEGTILDVIEAAASGFNSEAQKEKDFLKIFPSAIVQAKSALLQTRDKLDVLRKANVVDAGGLGFLIILEGYLEALGGQFISTATNNGRSSEEVKKEIEAVSEKYEIISLVKNPKTDIELLKEKLKDLGNSLDVVQIGDRIKIHFHSNFPDRVRDAIAETGEVLDFQSEDIQEELEGGALTIGIVTEDLASLLPKIIERYRIELAPAILDWPDLKDIPGENIYQKMREMEKRGIKSFPKTSQATPKSYLEAFKKQLARFESVLCLTVTSKISGCYNSALQAKSMLSVEDQARVAVIDSTTVAAGQALLILRILEQIRIGRKINEILSELKGLLPQVCTYIIFEDPKWIESIGRITKSQANWVRRMKKIGLHPLMQIKEGVISKGGIVFAKSMEDALFKKIAKDSKETRKNKKIRVVINQADNLPGAENLKKKLKDELGAEVAFVSEGPSIICAGLGPGTLLAAWAPVQE